MGKLAVHFGAGNIGRGMIATFLYESGYTIAFADVTQEACDTINRTPVYTVKEISADGIDEKAVSRYYAINSRTNAQEVIDAIAQAELVTCAVGPRNLEHIAPIIAKGIQARSSELAPLAVIACENALGGTDILAKHIRSPKNTSEDDLYYVNQKARFANAAIDRIVPMQDNEAAYPLDVKLEQFYEWIVDRTPFNDCGIPTVEGIQWVNDLEPYIERKLFTVNTAHATAAYYGYNMGKSTIAEAMRDPAIVEKVRAACRETSRLIVDKHEIDAKKQEKYVEKILKRISNPHLEDTVERVGRDPLRKLGRKERFLAPALELAEAGKPADALLDAAEMAFRFNGIEGDAESMKLGDILSKKKAEDVVADVCKVSSGEALYPKLVEMVQRVQVSA